MKISSYLPERVLSNEELSELFPEWTPKKIEKKLGVRTRHISAQDETALDMAVKASERIFESVDRGIIVLGLGFIFQLVGMIVSF